MKLLQIASGDFFSTYGGGQVYVKNIVDEMIRQRHDVAVLSFVNKEICITQADYNRIPLWEIGKQANVSDIENLLLSISPDIIHAHSQKALFSALGQKLHIPVVITAHHGGILCPAGTLMNANNCICKTTLSHNDCLKCSLKNIRTGSLWYPFMKLLPVKNYIRLGNFLQKKRFIPFVTPIGSAALSIENKMTEWQTICDKSTAVIAPSNAIAEVMRRNWLSQEKITVVPHGIPKTTPIAPYDSKKEKIRFFYVGRICHIKGVHILLEAFNGIKHNDKAELHIIGGAGNKSEERYMLSLRNRYKSENIIWHGKVPAEEIFNTINEYDIMVHPTICLEIFGLNISEALAMNKPVLATRCGGSEMQIKDGVNGWLIPTNDAISLRNKIDEIATKGININTCSLHENVISIDKHVESILNVYNKLLNRP